MSENLQTVIIDAATALYIDKDAQYHGKPDHASIAALDLLLEQAHQLANAETRTPSSSECLPPAVFSDPVIDREAIARIIDPDAFGLPADTPTQYSSKKIARSEALKIADAIIRSLTAQPRDDDPLADLVSRFSAALLSKLRVAEKKYGYNNDWQRDGWAETCREHLLEHIAKGDPRDVAAYCAFIWHHGWSTAPEVSAAEIDRVVIDALKSDAAQPRSNRVESE